MSHRLETIFVHGGSEPDATTGAVTPAISLATTFAQRSLGNLHGVDAPNSHGRGFEYSRTGNPTRGAFERAIAAAEHAQHGIAFASGLAATTAIIQTLSRDDHVLCIDDVYGGTQVCPSLSSPPLPRSLPVVCLTCRRPPHLSSTAPVVATPALVRPQRLFRRIVAPNSGIEFDFADMSLPVISIAQHVRDNTKIVWLETPTNPTLKVVQ